MDTSSDCEMLLHLLRENSHWRWKSPLCSGLAEGMHHLIPTSPSLWRLSWDLNGASSLQRGKFLPEWMVPNWGLQDVALSATPALRPISRIWGFLHGCLEDFHHWKCLPTEKVCADSSLWKHRSNPRNQTSLDADGKLRIYTSYGLVTPPLLIPQGSKYQKPQIPKAPKLFTAVIPETVADLLGQSVRVLPHQDLGMSLFHSTVTWSITYCDWSF